MTLGLSETEVAAVVNTELLALGNYTLTHPGGRPVFTKEQRDAIAHAVSTAIKANNDKLIEQLKAAGVSGLKAERRSET